MQKFRKQHSVIRLRSCNENTKELELRRQSRGAAYRACSLLFQPIGAQAMLRTDFPTCLMLTIAHRMHTVSDSDVILAMEDGKSTASSRGGLGRVFEGVSQSAPA